MAGYLTNREIENATNATLRGLIKKAIWPRLKPIQRMDILASGSIRELVREDLIEVVKQHRKLIP
jgi:hypothetical protein